MNLLLRTMALLTQQDKPLGNTRRLRMICFYQVVWECRFLPLVAAALIMVA